MYKFPYQGKSLGYCIGKFKRAYKENKLNLEVMMWGVESLRNSPEDMRKYFDALTDITEDAAKKYIRNCRSTTGVQQVNAGTPIREVAQNLVYDRLRRLINHYNTKGVHKKWNAALPELKTAG